MKWLEEELKDVEGKEEIIKNIKTNLAKEFIPKSEFNSKNDEVKELKDQVVERDKQLTELKKSAKGNEDLTKKIEELEADNARKEDEYNKKVTQLKKTQIATKKLTESKAKDIDVNLALINLDDYELNEDGNELVGFDNFISDHKKKYGYLYEESNANFNGFKPKDGSDGGQGGSDSLGSKFAQLRNKKEGPAKSMWD